jgi:hypothetical protein
MQRIAAVKKKGNVMESEKFFLEQESLIKETKSFS